MKKLLLTSALVAVCAGAFAQGKVNVVNDGASLVTLSTATGALLAADVGKAGQAVGNANPLPSGVVLIAGLYAGTSSTALFLYNPNNGANPLLNNASAGAGVAGPFAVQLNAATSSGGPSILGITSGTAITASTPWMQVRVWDSAFATYALALGKSYTGETPLFQMNPGPGVIYPLCAPASGNSSWVDGPILLSAPEPSTFALAGLGAAALMIFRRRK
jgi:PEP-CTERM motif